MIKLVHGRQNPQDQDLLDQMFRLRARVFNERLGWEVNVENGREIDRFDELEPLYALSLSHRGDVVGSLRLLQTTGPNMLADVFFELLPEGVPVRSPLIWESTRFCMDMDYKAPLSPNGLSMVTGELLCSLCEIGLLAGLSHIVTVFDLRMERILRRADCPYERLSPPRRIGKVMTMAALFEVSEAMNARLHKAAGIDRPVIDEHGLPAMGVGI